LAKKKPALETWYSFTRPYSSDKGASILYKLLDWVCYIRRVWESSQWSNCISQDKNWNHKGSHGSATIFELCHEFGYSSGAHCWCKKNYCRRLAKYSALESSSLTLQMR
jgi:hypothetical protein